MDNTILDTMDTTLANIAIEAVPSDNVTFTTNANNADGITVVGFDSIANTTNDTNIVSLNPTQSFVPPLRKSQKQSKTPSYLQSYKCNSITCAKQTQSNSAIMLGKSYL